jgi:hypothetical protein
MEKKVCRVYHREDFWCYVEITPINKRHKKDTYRDAKFEANEVNGSRRWLLKSDGTPYFPALKFKPITSVQKIFYEW